MKRLMTLFVLLGLLVPMTVFGQAVDYTVDYTGASKPYWPLVVRGGGYTTTFTVSNFRDKFTSVNLYCVKQDGLPLEGKFYDDGVLVGTGSQYVPNLPANSSREITFTMDGGQTFTGYVFALIPKVAGQDSATVSVSYSYAPLGSVTAQATIDSVPPMSGFGFYAQSSFGPDQDNVDTGLSMVNPTSVAALVSLTLSGTTGSDTGFCKPILVPAYGQVVGYVRELCELSNPYRGLVKGSSSVPLVVGALKTTTSKKGVYSYSKVDVTRLP